MRMIKPLLLRVLFATLLFVSCRKTDIPTIDATAINAQTVEGKFFGQHRTASVEESAIAEFVRGRNSKTHFVEETVKRIGYPRWDKMVKVKTGNSMVIKSNSTTSPTSSYTDSYYTYYLPFVKDSQNHVNATMIITTSPNDTALNYMCDWQYRNRPYGSAKVDTSAERYAMFFMMMDNRTFGHKEFDIIDSRLFASSNSSSGTKRVGLYNKKNPSSSGITNTDLLVIEQCTDFYTCRGDSYCSLGCDYLNCIDVGGPNYCELNATICYYSFSTGGGTSWSISGDTGSGGNSGGGYGGNGNPGDLPMLPCEGDPYQASKPNQPAYSTIQSNNAPCGGSGWVAYNVEIPNEAVLENYDDNINNYPIEEDPMQITFDLNNDPWPTISSVVPLSKFVGFDGRNCLLLAQDQLTKMGVTDLGSSNVFTAFKLGVVYPAATKDGINYIISKLKTGLPVMVGVDNKSGSPNGNPDLTTDHFVVIVGCGTDANGRNFFRFYDNASPNLVSGASANNRLYYDTNTGKITGTSTVTYANLPPRYAYSITHIRKNK